MSKKLEIYIEELLKQMGEQEMEIQIAMLRIERLTEAGNALNAKVNDGALKSEWEKAVNDPVQ
jgi:hypothetical protein